MYSDALLKSVVILSNVVSVRALTFHVQVGGPVPDNMRRLPGAALVQTWIIDDAMADGGRVEIVKCGRQRRHVPGSDGSGSGSCSGAGGIWFGVIGIFAALGGRRAGVGRGGGA